MINFATLLSAYIKEKNIVINDLIRYTGLDRSSMYKIIKGTRKPTNLELVNNIATYLCLNNKERTDLIESYYISIEGEFAYYARRNILTFLNEATTNIENKKLENIVNISKIKLKEGQSTTIFGKKYLEHIIQEIVLNETTKENPVIKILEQPGDISSLSTLKMASEINNNLEIIHLFCLNSNKTIDSKNRFYNLYCFQKIIPFFISDSKYTPYYYYNQINSIMENFTLFQNAIISSDYVLTYTNDFEYAILYCDEKIRQIHLDLFDKYIENSRVFTSSFDYLDYFDYMENNHNSNNANFYYFNTSICPTLILDENEEFSSKHIKENFKNRDLFIEFFHEYTNTFKSFVLNNNQNVMLFTKQGIEYFSEEGYISEIHPSLVEPLDNKEKKNFLSKWVNLNKTHDNFCMLDIFKHPGSSNITLTFTPTQGLVVFPRNDGTLLYIKIEESSLVSVFYDFLDFMHDHHKVNKEDTIEYLNKKIASL